MIVISAFFVPLYHRLKVHTAYEFLESRFDLKTRTLTALLFLTGRGLAAGLTIFAPSLIVSVILGWPLAPTIAVIGVGVVVYTTTGGTRAVTHTQMLQAAIILAGMATAFAVLWARLPGGRVPPRRLACGWRGRAHERHRRLGQPQRPLHPVLGPHRRRVPGARLLRHRPVPGAALPDRTLGGPLAARAAAQRHAQGADAARHPAPGRHGLRVLPAHAAAGALQPGRGGTGARRGPQVAPSPLPRRGSTGPRGTGPELRRPSCRHCTAGTPPGGRRPGSGTARPRRPPRPPVGRPCSTWAVGLLPATPTTSSSSFVVGHLPAGVVGLVLAAVFAAAMSASAAELNALASTTEVDIVRRLLHRNGSDRRTLLADAAGDDRVGRVRDRLRRAGRRDGLAGGGRQRPRLAVLRADPGGLPGGILPASVVGGTAVFAAALIAEAAVLACYALTGISFLWFNLIGCVVVVAFGARDPAGRPSPHRRGGGK